MALSAIAIDTNLFSVLLRYYSLESDELSDLKRERGLQEVWGRKDPPKLEQFDALWQFFENARRRIVTQHVVAEAFTSRMRKRSDWHKAISLLPNHVVECGCSISALYSHREFRRIMEEIGPTDACLIYVAAEEKATIISEDGRLRYWADVREVPALTLDELARL
jgi:rRNA-processing protein FCF1